MPVRIMVVVGAFGWASVALAASPSCRANTPAELSDVRARWLGDCEAGRASGLGVLRVGTRAPYQFYAGRMQAGRPVRGVLVQGDGTQRIAARFDRQLRAVPGDSLKPAETDVTFALAARAARGVSSRFRDQGNPHSAAFYAHLAATLQPSE